MSARKCNHRRLRDILRQLRRECRGAIAVETAFALVVLMVALAGVIDFGDRIRIQIALKQALRSAAQLALDLGAIGQVDYSDPAAVRSAILPTFQEASGLSTADIATTDISITCICSDGSTSGPNYCAGEGNPSYTACPDDRPGEEFLYLKGTADFSPAFTFLPMFTSGMTVGAELNMRVK